MWTITLPAAVLSRTTSSPPPTMLACAGINFTYAVRTYKYKICLVSEAAYTKYNTVFLN